MGEKFPYIFAFLLFSILAIIFFFQDILFQEKILQTVPIEIKEKNASLKYLNQNQQIDQNYSNSITQIQKYIDEAKKTQEIQKAKITQKKTSKVKDVTKISKPKLAIIIDDVGFSEQVKSIKKLPFKVTPSFFPPNSRYLNTPILAKEFEHYMIHYPMQAFDFDKQETNAILISNSKEKLIQKMKKLRENFPKAIFINNHTGSKFTSDFEAMDRLFYAMNLYGFKFLDSRTSIDTKGVQVGKLYNQKVLERNIFLDNESNVKYIQNQLKLAVFYAKKHGFAIAICHPRVKTFEVLMNADDILKDVELVYINELL